MISDIRNSKWTKIYEAMYGSGLDKSCDRLAMEIKGKDRREAEKHLMKYGMSDSDAAAVVSRVLQTKSQKVSDDVKDIAKTIRQQVGRR
jgi:hypothetical protein